MQKPKSYNIPNWVNKLINNNQKVICPDCKSEILMEANSGVGDILECSVCGTEVEITSKDPLKYREIIETK